MTELSEELQEAVATIKAIPAKMGLDKQSPAAAAVDDNPVRSCDPNGYQMMMNKEDYEAVSAWKPEVEVTEEGDILVQAQITFPAPLNYLRYVAPPPNDELARLEAKAMDEILRGTILPAHMLQGAPFEEDPPQDHWQTTS